MVNKMATEPQLGLDVEAYFSAVLQASDDVFFLLDTEGYFRYYLAQDESLLWVPPEVFMNQHIQAVFDSEMGQMIMNSFQTVLKTGRKLTIEYPSPAPQHQWYEASFAKIEVPSLPPCVAIVIRDISRRKQAEIALQRFQQGLQALNEISFDPELDFNSQMDQALALVLNYFQLDAAFISKIEDEKYTVLSNVSEQDAFRWPRKTVFKLNKVVCEQTWQQRKTLAIGDLIQDPPAFFKELEEVPYQAYIGMPYLVENKPMGTVCLINRDPIANGFTTYDQELLTIFARWLGFAMDQHLKSQHLKQLNQVKAQMIRLISHDLRSPLTAIQGLVQISLLDDNDLNIKVRENLEMVLYSSRNATELLESILQVEHVGNEAYTLLPVPLTHIMQGELLKVTFQAEEMGIKLVTELDHDLRVMLNPRWMGQAVSNLLRNALKFTPAGGQVSVSIFENKGRLRCQIQDSGIGIPARLLPQIFEAFTPSRRKGLRGETTTGLGLYLVKQIIEQHGGVIRCESQENQGSCFSFDLPLLDSVSSIG